MPSILHISDLHFGPPYVPQIGEALRKIAGELRPELIVASGDFTQRAKREQFEQARGFLDSLPNVPKVCVPGNHDVPLYRVRERLFSPFGLYRECLERELDGVLRHEGLVVVWLNSTSPRRAISNGRIHKDQLDFCERQLRDVPSAVVKVVVAHHHFSPSPDFEHDRTMPKARRALDQFVELGVDMILGGHLHRAYIGNSLDVYAGTDREHGIIIVQCGTTTSHRGRGREREKNSFNMIEAGRDSLRVTHFLYFERVGRFAPTSRHLFPRPGRGPCDLAFGGDLAGAEPGPPHAGRHPGRVEIGPR